MTPIPLPQLPDDGRNYRLFQHCDGMRCLLVSDPAATRATCVVQVGSGSHDEPDSHPGLAHLLEHMLFMGSGSYPVAGSFAALVARWSGRFNASTGPELTRFFFSVSAEGLHACGLQLADMLAAPLLTPDLVASERRVIDSEFLTRLADDALHEQAAFAHVVNPAHPMSRFSAGNLRSLQGTAQELALQVRAFHGTHYRASNMVLVLHGSHAADELLQLATQFAGRQTIGQPPARQPVTVIRQDMLPCHLLRQSALSRPRYQLIYPLGDIGWLARGSEGHWLREWIACTSPSGAQGWLRGKGLVADMTARIELFAGDQGLLYVEAAPYSDADDHRALLDAWQQWLNWLATLDPAVWPHGGRAALLDQAFANGTTEESVMWLKRLAHRLQHLPAESLLEPEASRRVPDPRRWQELLSQLRPDALVLVQTSQQHPWPARACWTDTGFSLTRLLWQAPEDAAELKLEEGPDYSLPTAHAPDPLPTNRRPGLRVERFVSTVRSGREIRTRIGWFWPVAQVTESQLVWLQACWTLQCESLAHGAMLCGVDLNWQRAAGRLSVTLTGRSAALLSGITRGLLKNLLLPPGLTVVRLAGQRLSLWQASQREKLPAYRCLDALEQALLPWDQAETPPLTPEGAHSLWQRLMDQAQIGWLQPVEWHTQAFDTSVLARAFPAVERKFMAFVPQPVRLAPGVGVLPVDVAYPDRAQVLYCQGEGDAPENRAGWLLVHHLLAGPFFDSLRTRQGLGYWVVARYHEVGGVPGIIWLVQSPSHSHRQISDAVDDFLQEQRCVIGGLPFEHLRTQAQALADALQAGEEDVSKLFEEAWSNLSGLSAGDVRTLCGALRGLQTEHWHATLTQLWEKPARFRLISTSPSKVAG